MSIHPLLRRWPAALAVAVVAVLGFALGRGTGRASTPFAPPATAAAPESLYVAGRRALSDGRHREAAALFARLSAESSPRAADAPYWEALARYRAGDQAELRAGLRALEAQARRHPRAATRAEAAALASRIRSLLRGGGDPSITVPEEVTVDVDSPCAAAGSDESVTALSSLLDEDPARAAQVLGTLARRRDCPPEVRRRAVMLLAQRPTPVAAEIVLDAARNDPSPEVRAEAAMWLGAFPEARVLPVLDSIARAAAPEERENAVAGIAQLHTDDARASIERLLRDPSASPELKRDALNAVMGFDPGVEEAALLRGLYPSLEPDLQRIAIQALGHVEDAGNAEWLLRMGLDPATPSSLAGEAIFWSARAGIARERLIALYPTLKDPYRRERLLHAMNEADPPALELLRHAAEHDPDPTLRINAREWLRERGGKP